MTTAADNANGSLVKNSNFCFCPLSRTEKSLGSKPPTNRPWLSATVTGTSTRFLVTVIVYRSCPVSESFGTLPAGTVLTGGIGGGVGLSSVLSPAFPPAFSLEESGALRGISFEPVVTPAPELSAGAAFGWVSSSASCRGLGASGGGIDRK